MKLAIDGHYLKYADALTAEWAQPTPKRLESGMCPLAAAAMDNERERGRISAEPATRAHVQRLIRERSHWWRKTA